MIKIVSDSTCDLPQELLQKLDIAILPLFIRLGAEEFEDAIDISPKEIYSWADANKSTPQTAAPSLTRATELFSRLCADDNELICFAISEQMSSSANIMRLAAESIDRQKKIHIIDSANLSSGMGLLVLEAAEMARDGKTAHEIIACIEALKTKIKASFVVDSLTYLHRGGRCGAVAALAGSMLHIHPKIVVENGKMSPARKYKGKTDKAILAYTKELEPELMTALPKRVFITHSGCAEQSISQVEEYLRSLQYFDEIIISRAGGVVSSHCGPGTLGVLFIAK